MTDLEVFIVPHTHWDREWYLPLEGYRHRLSLLMDRVLGLLSDGTLPCFVLDGQTVAIDDWLERHPERRDELAAHVRAGRLAIGPWFVLADELLVSGEALIRNLSEGMRLARSLGACSQVAYSPDPFGHVSQLPQIVRSFGMDTVMFARGLGDEPSTTACVWQGPDGSRVRAAILTTSYSNGRLLTHEPDMSARIAAEVERLRPHLAAPVALICTGSDHEIVDARLAPGVAEAASRLAPWRVRFGTYDDYVAALSRCVDARNGEGLGVHSGVPQGEQGAALVGELRGARTPDLVGELRGARLLPLLPGVMSAHIPIKQANERCLDLLESVAEPLSALSHALGGPDPSRLLRAAWRELLLNHAHDSICGCSVDPVHRENKVRFERVEQMASAVADEAMGYLCGQVTRMGDEGEHRVAINPLPVARTAMVAVTVRESLRPDDVGDGPMENSAAAMRRALSSLRKTEGASVWTATANDGCARRVQVLDEALGEGEFPFLSAQPMRTTRLLVECALPGFGLEAFRLERRRGPEGQS
ncbi:MAG: hypothetical protein EB084_08550, partial [Proteobacteria bacterium]|nr:hypothetical protein [Pseudomonadota bacterium]